MLMGLAGCDPTGKQPTGEDDTGRPPDSAGPDTADSETGTAPDTDTGEDTAEVIDLDADGYNTTEDCDDTRADIHPGAPKVCDWVDHDCDGAYDCDGKAAWATSQPLTTSGEGVIFPRRRPRRRWHGRARLSEIL